MTAEASLRRALAVLVRPLGAWREIAADDTPPDKIFSQYVMPLAAIPALCAGIGQILYGHALPRAAGQPEVHVPVGWLYAAGYAVIGYLQLLAAVATAAYVVRRIAPALRLPGDVRAAMKTSGYGATPYVLGGIFLLIPPHNVIQGAGTLAALLYGFVEVVFGLRATLKATLLAAVSLAAVSLVLAFVASLITLTILGLALKPFVPA